MEYKHLPTFTKAIEDRTVTGIFAVHGNVDSGGDRSFPGLFGDFTANGRKRTVYLWQHDYTQPPTAKIDEIYEVNRADLPPEVLQYASEATGGVAVKRTYLDTPRGNEVLGALRNDALREMSYAYEPTDWKFETVNERQVRSLFKADLLDISDVNWGMNPATLGSKRLAWKDWSLTEHIAAVEADWNDLVERFCELKDRRAKEGRVLSGENRKRIESTLEVLDGAMKVLQDLLTATEPQKSAVDPQEVLRAFVEVERTRHYLNGVLN